MTDKYLGFTYKGVHSSTYGVFIINEGSDLRFSNSPSFSNEFAFPKFGNTSLLLGTNKENRTISLKIMAKSLNLEQYRKMLGWLNIEERGNLSFDFNPNYGFYVKIESISEGTFLISEKCVENSKDKYSIELEISFVTIGDWAAKWVGNSAFISLPTGSLAAQKQLIDNDLNLDFASAIISNDYTLELLLKNNHNIENFYKIEFKGNIEVFDGNSRELFYKTEGFTGEGILYTKYGICVDRQGNFIPLSTNRGVFKVKSLMERKLEITREEFGYIKISPDSREIL